MYVQENTIIVTRLHIKALFIMNYTFPGLIVFKNALTPFPRVYYALCLNALNTVHLPLSLLMQSGSQFRIHSFLHGH